MVANQWLRCLFIAGLLLHAGKAGSAETVTLKARNGTFEITGAVVSIDGRAITIDSPVAGTMVLDLGRFECVGNACSTGSISRSDGFSIQGSNTIGAALMPALVEAYAGSQNLRVEKRVGATPEEIGLDMLDGTGQKTVAIDLRSHGSGTAFPALAKGTAEIGASSRPIKVEEEKMLADAGFLVDAHVLALDGILVLVSPDNPVSDLTLDQIADIFSGRITDWSQVGGTAGEIEVYSRDEKSGTTDSFNALVMDPRKVKLAPRAVRKESSVELSDLVAQNERAIGFAGFAYLRNAKALAIRGVCGAAFPPTQFNVKTEEYPLSRRLFLYATDKMASSQAKALLGYTLSDAAQKTILGTGFIDQSIDALPFKEQPHRISLAFSEDNDEINIESMKQLVTLISEAQRMSVTYRFEKNETQLDLKARQDVSRLARFLERPEMQRKEILLVGFADSTGPFAANLPMSLARAETVRTAVITAGGSRIDPKAITAKGYSETLPVDCNSTVEGRAKNRRVEVWVRDMPKAAQIRAPAPAPRRAKPAPPPAVRETPAPNRPQPPRP